MLRRRRSQCLCQALLLALAPWAAAACSGPERGAGEPPIAPGEALEEGRRYVEDAGFRRERLLLSLENPENGYSALRQDRYTEEAWGSLPEWLPRAAPARGSEAAPPAPGAPAWQALDVDGTPWEEEALTELGRTAFLSYPVQIATHLRRALGPEAPPDRYGLPETEAGVGSVAWVELPGDLTEAAFTCATCHSTLDGDGLVLGRNNADFDLGRLLIDHGAGAPIGWGPGRVDVTADDADNPVSIADLRAVRSQTHLQRAATVRNGLIPLSIRTETLIITSLGEAARPPRKLAFALALYLWQLEPVPLRTPGPATARGKATFARECSRCHAPPDYTGEPVALQVVGTDPSVGQSSERTTGTYRVPSLRGVGDRRRLLASGAAADIRELLDPGRSAAGHDFGLSLDRAEREDLVAFLETL